MKKYIIYAAIALAVVSLAISGWAIYAKQASSKPACDNPQIKGNINRSGVKIYHLPSGKFYNRTQIDTAAGEKMFCSIEDAQEAGFRESDR